MQLQNNEKKNECTTRHMSSNYLHLKFFMRNSAEKYFF